MHGSRTRMLPFGVVQLRQDARRPQRCEGRAERGETRLAFGTARVDHNTGEEGEKEKKKRR